MVAIAIAALFVAVAAVERRHHHHHRKAEKFAEGMAWEDKLNLKIHLKEADKGGYNGRLMPVKLNQKKFAEGYNEDEELGESLKMKENDAKKAKNWLRTYKFAEGPKDSSLVEFDLVASKGPGLPSYPTGNAPTAPPRGENGWQTWAQDFVDWEDAATATANARTPYTSTLVNLNAADDDTTKMENFVMEDNDIPLNMRFVHIENNLGDDLIMIEKQ
jgi:hypothetical protein